MNLEKERGERRRRVIAHAWHVANTLSNSSTTIYQLVEKVKVHEISEWDLVEQTQQEVLTLFAECGLTELVEKFMAFILTEQALRSSSEGEALDTPRT